MNRGRVLIVAGSDSGGGAGIQADVKTVTMLGGFAMTAVTALTAQNTLGVEAVMPVPTEMVLKQIDAVAGDIGVDAVKLGMIGTSETAAALADWLEARPDLPVVFDPVMVATSGSVLADAATIAAFGRLAVRATLTTPNLPELEALSGMAARTSREVEAAARSLAARTGQAVLAKGGHLSDGPLVDLLVEAGGDVRRWQAERIDTPHTHGTGCTLASGIGCGLAQGMALADSIARARDYVRAAIRAAPGFGRGHGPMGHALGRVPFDLIHRKE